MHTQTYPPWSTLTSQWPSQSSVLTPMELISHGSMVHLLPQTLAGLQSHHVDTEHNHFCLSALFLWHTEKKTRTRECPVGCYASSLRFNVNLILSLVPQRFRLKNRRGEKQFCNQRLLPPPLTSTHTLLHLHKQRLKKSKGYHLNSSRGSFKDLCF